MKRLLIDQKGITLIEIMVVVVIIGILSTVIFTRVADRPEQARRTKAMTEIRAMQTSLELFKLDNGYYPSTEQGLDALVSTPTSGRIPSNYPESGYIEKLRNDPWQTPYVYISPGSHGDYDIESFGHDQADGGTGKNKDIESWSME